MRENTFEAGSIEKQIVAKANKLAHAFYKTFGITVPGDHKFYDSTVLNEKRCWQMAIIAFSRFEGTDIEGALDVIRRIENAAHS